MPEKKIITSDKKEIKPPSCPFATIGTVLIQMMIRTFSDPMAIVQMPTITMVCKYCKFYNQIKQKCIAEILLEKNV